MHGDIKPQNILVFDENGSIKAKVADLGYSTTTDSASTLLYLPKSPPWNDPKWHHRGVSLLEGKRMDIFSFGMLSFWILFANVFEKESGSATMDATQKDLSVSGGITSSFHCLESWKMKGMLCEVAHRFVESDKTLDCEQKSAMKAFFDKALHEDPKSRDTSFEYLFSLDPSIRIPMESDISPPKPPGIETASSNLSSHIDFSVCTRKRTPIPLPKLSLSIGCKIDASNVSARLSGARMYF
jgi:serine/threonine protein kinase